MNPSWCFDVPELNYECSKKFKNNKGVYKDYLRYSTCLDLKQIEVGCGPRDLFGHTSSSVTSKISASENFRHINVDDTSGDVSMCLWRLFDKNQTSPNRFLRYHFGYNPEAFISDTSLFLFNDKGLDHVDLNEAFIRNGQTSFTVSALDYETSNVYLMARKRISNEPHPHFKLKLEFTYEEHLPMSAGEIFAIMFFLILFLAVIVMFILLQLNKRGIVTFYIPK